MTGTQEHQSRQKTARIGEQFEQITAGKMIFRAAGFGEFQQVQMPVSAPVDDVIAVIALNLVDQPFAGDAMSQEMGDDAALWVDFLGKQPQQVAPFLPCA